MSHASLSSPADLLPPSAQYLPQSRRGDGWDALADVEAELEAMDREWVRVHRREREPDFAPRWRLIGLIWTLTFGGL
jgi:hypothetical protein